LSALELVNLLAPELDSVLYLESLEDCYCDDLGDIWINPYFILELQELTGLTLRLLLEIVISHELGHAFLLKANVDSFNEVAAWLVGEAIFSRLGYGEFELRCFHAIRDAILPTYESDDRYESWFMEAEEIASEGLALLKS
jgi:hypothetical protein